VLMTHDVSCQAEYMVAGMFRTKMIAGPARGDVTLRCAELSFRRDRVYPSAALYIVRDHKRIPLVNLSAGCATWPKARSETVKLHPGDLLELDTWPDRYGVLLYLRLDLSLVGVDSDLPSA
jgi:hypothetical protein